MQNPIKYVWATKESMKALKKVSEKNSETTINLLEPRMEETKLSIIVDEDPTNMPLKNEVLSTEVITTFPNETTKASKNIIEEVLDVSLNCDSICTLKKSTKQNSVPILQTLATKEDKIQRKTPKNSPLLKITVETKDKMKLEKLVKKQETVFNTVSPRQVTPKNLPQKKIDLLDSIITNQQCLLADKYKSEQEKALEKQSFELEKRRKSHFHLGLGPIEKQKKNSSEGKTIKY